jgi:hypothetical protein
MRDDKGVAVDDESETPGTVIASVAVGVTPLPFLAVYATLFIARGGFRPVNPPDITSSAHGELIAGLIAALLFIVGSISVFWFVGGTRRWLFALGQAATLATAIDFVSDATSGPASIPVLLIITSVISLVLAFLPASSTYMGDYRRARRNYSEPAEAGVDIR